MFKLIVLILLVSVAQAFPQSAEKYKVFTGKGEVSSIEAIVNSLDKTDVVFLGEMHDDAVGHAVQLEIFGKAIEQYALKRPITLSLEMFERDVQIVLDEYLNGLISENHFLSSSRPWGNYKTDYRPLMELAKEKKLDVVAANAPRRYVNMVSRGGRETLQGLSKQAKSWLAPLPYAEASEAYSSKFKSLMGSSAEAQKGLDKILSSQSLWDATMAYSVAESLKKRKGSLVVHLNGGFHTERRLGTVEHFLRYRKNGRAIVVTIRYEDDFRKFDTGKHNEAGDFVILTQKQPKLGAVTLDILRRLADHAKKLKSLKANVRMVKFNGQLLESDEFQGDLTFVAGLGDKGFASRVNWSKPFAEQLVMSNHQYVLYRPTLGQAFVGRLQGSGVDATIERAYGFLKMRPNELKSHFSVSYLGEATIEENVRTFHVQLDPIGREIFKSLEAWVDADGMPRQIRIRDENNDTTTIVFSEIQKNVPVAGEIFSLRFPKGTKVIKG